MQLARFLLERLLLDAMLLGLHIARGEAFAADAFAHAGAPASTVRLVDAVVTDLVAVAPADAHAGNPGALRPLAAVTLLVEALPGERALAQVVAVRAANGRTAGATTGRPADTCLRERWAFADS